jgi:hypothetical protein
MMEAYQVNSSIQSSAAERTPIELWRMILLLAVESPLLPHNGDDNLYDAFRRNARNLDQVII